MSLHNVVKKIWYISLRYVWKDKHLTIFLPNSNLPLRMIQSLLKIHISTNISSYTPLGNVIRFATISVKRFLFSFEESCCVYFIDKKVWQL